MTRLKLPINEIIVLNRQREIDEDYLVNDLMPSIQKVGLVQPIVVNHDKRLIAGGHRLEAHKRLGSLEIDVVYRETLSEDELAELELVENVCRRNLTWQQQCLAVAKIHKLKQRQAILSDNTWGQRETAALFGYKTPSVVNYALHLAILIIQDDKEILECQSFADAWRVVMRRDEESALAELAKRHRENVNNVKNKELEQKIDQFQFSIATAAIRPDTDKEQINILRERAKGDYLTLSKSDAKTLYLSNPLNDPLYFNEYYNEKREMLVEQFTLNLSNILLHTDAIAYMSLTEQKERFDHIITDIPYGIDMDMLNQQNDGHSFKNIDSVLAEHEVMSNEALFRKFFPAAYYCLKPDAYLITFCDQMQWQFMYNLAIKAGFKIQRWPHVWVKTGPCINGSPQYNQTKSTEIAIICRKGNATLVNKGARNVSICSHDEMRRESNHPFVKPFDLWKDLIELVSIEGQTILEPFAGVGSGVCSLIRLKRNYVACEINEQHYNALINNVKAEYQKLNPHFLFK